MGVKIKVDGVEYLVNLHEDSIFKDHAFAGITAYEYCGDILMEIKHPTMLAKLKGMVINDDTRI